MTPATQDGPEDVNPRPKRALPKSVLSDHDVALMLAFKDGDYDAFGELVDRHAKALVNYFFFQSHDADLAEDCAQEVWVRVFKARRDYEPRARFKTYLFRVARNYWIDVYRTVGRRGVETSLDGDVAGTQGAADGGQLKDRLPTHHPGPEALAENRELALELARALADLPDEMREVYLLGEVEGLPYAEVASILGIPIGTVKSRMFNAIRRLREMLARRRGEGAENP